MSTTLQISPVAPLRTMSLHPASAQAADLVHAVAQLVHELQRERAYSCLLLGSRGERFGASRQEQLMASREAEAVLREAVAQDLPCGVAAAADARLGSRIACALHGLAGLAVLRHQTTMRAWSVTQVIAAFGRIIADLLAVVRELAWQTGDAAQVERLKALHWLMLGKEYAGQERALGASAFGAGCIGAAERQTLAALLDAQAYCFGMALRHGPAELQRQWRSVQDAPCTFEVDCLRATLRDAPADAALDTDLTMPWFLHCTQRIDLMHGAETDLIDAMRVGSADDPQPPTGRPDRAGDAHARLQ